MLGNLLECDYGTKMFQVLAIIGKFGTAAKKSRISIRMRQNAIWRLPHPTCGAERICFRLFVAKFVLRLFHLEMHCESRAARLENRQQIGFPTTTTRAATFFRKM